MGKDKDKHLSKSSRPRGESSSPQKETCDTSVPGKEHQPRGSDKNQTSKNRGNDSCNDKTSSYSLQINPLIPDFSEPVNSDIIPEIKSSTAMYSEKSMRCLFRGFQPSKIKFNLLSFIKRQSSANTNADTNEPPLNVMAEDDDACSFLGR